MRVVVVLAGVLTAAMPADAGPRVFHTQGYADATMIELSVLDDSPAHDLTYDFDVEIGLARTNAVGTRYVDPAHHHARVRCAEPAYVAFGDRRFPVGRHADDWKEDLWKAYCTVPSS